MSIVEILTAVAFLVFSDNTTETVDLGVFDDPL
ncbi:hypothetical protein F4561_006218 [Lipingzhangella halophila]|uniref:Uncharacterized protein n=1 Tax=Lipingzhangella halophila TaxID=1783352 RepID=A0A7W7W6V0_9ACTN|nr:hypothetical protein [Lipingzhangella halophila]